MTESREAFAGPKGVPDYLPPDSSAFVAVRDTMLAAARRAGYGDIELPIFEDTALFARGVGESTDVVSKEMYTFADRGDRSVTLRPEGTAGVVRAVIEHHLDRGMLPVKLCYAGPFFRYERPQAGRYRQLQQVGVEAIGVDDPALDAEVIAVADTAFRSLGLTEFRLEITSLGDDTCRPAYRQRLQDFLFGLDLDAETRRRAEINPLRVLDDKRAAIQEMTADAPVLIDHLSESARSHFDTVLAHLDALGVPYVINPRMVRGLDYYTKTTFEFVHDGLGAQSGIGGGGRYDGLMAQLGGADLSGIGFGLGVDRTLLALAAEQRRVGTPARCEVFGVPLGQRAKIALATVAADLRALGLRVDLAYGDRGLKGAMRAADRSGAVVALVAGDRDLDAGTVGVKDLVAGTQTDVAHADVADTVAALVAAAAHSGNPAARTGV
ncbi:histidine--tRNA ligase [Mycobacterium koreense]|uniref:Histidine--tRNA ligase n=1 Tax=Mycolicibacillus koreensis TaxID=1069220 RepID=A0A7I7SAX3_9MYCO|nr:histidine--tRNA ligase [Mycolicibacillus koreensis]MCV7247497.1 histidine--tRNA ligase [Mycolicibacillus koreensis]ODR06889.1 histidine--tRNA ligase [Mycolicibacillus koreensis]OSC34556.1 histidine--tRNA ligase [Mycolicibacillus koreensis]BBY53873.1 histidine--tRNA ligase [Mycolicibacillus koreensis]